jgi:hypothetical protein
MSSTSKVSLKRKLSTGYITEQMDANVAPRKIIRVAATLVQQQAVEKHSVSPQDYLMYMLSSQGYDVPIRPYDAIPGFFAALDQEGVNSYGSDVLTATREGDLDALRAFHIAGRPLNCSNRFGESLMHLACRRSHLKVVHFLVHEVGVPLTIADDMGRSPLHDAFWTPKPNFELIDLIVTECPDLLYVSDKRGHLPLSYARQEHWSAWIEFLKQRSETVIPKKRW